VSYFFNEAASAEHLEYVAYYESCQAGLGARYLSAFDDAMDKVCQYPDRYRVEFPPDIRKFRVPSFPYNILYRLAGSTVEVLVVAPHRRRPGYWLGRL
jgi:plasmid stabilization system protein ParE